MCLNFNNPEYEYEYEVVDFTISSFGFSDFRQAYGVGLEQTLPSVQSFVELSHELVIQQKMPIYVLWCEASMQAPELYSNIIWAARGLASISNTVVGFIVLAV